MFGLRVGTPGGDAVFELIKFSFLNGIDVEVSGLGTCSAHWRSEDVKDVALKQPAS